MKILFASDHAGFELKQHLVQFVRGLGYEVEDMGADSYDELDDYPDYIMPLAEKVGMGDDRGIVLGGSGQGEAIAANRYKGVRAVVYYGGNKDIITLSREHNDANVLSLGVRFVNNEEAESVVSRWLDLPFSKEERHVRRIIKLDK